MSSSHLQKIPTTKNNLEPFTCKPIFSEDRKEIHVVTRFTDIDIDQYEDNATYKSYFNNESFNNEDNRFSLCVFSPHNPNLVASIIIELIDQHYQQKKRNNIEEKLNELLRIERFAECEAIIYFDDKNRKVYMASTAQFIIKSELIDSRCVYDYGLIQVARKILKHREVSFPPETERVHVYNIDEIEFIFLTNKPGGETSKTFLQSFEESKNKVYQCPDATYKDILEDACVGFYEKKKKEGENRDILEFFYFGEENLNLVQSLNRDPHLDIDIDFSQF